MGANRDISRDIFNKAMYSLSGNVSKSIQKRIEDQTKNTPEIKDTIKTCINKSGW